MKTLFDAVQSVPISLLREHPRNARQGDVGAIVESIKANGVFRPLVVQRSTDYVLAGNHTLKALRALKFTDVPIVYVDVDDDRALRILLVDNRTSDLASYDDSALVTLLQELRPTPAGLTGTGYDLDALDELLHDLGDGYHSGVDEVPPVPAAADTKPGDLYLMGEHRLLCGDSTNAADVARLLSGATPVFMATDPPYGIELDMEWRDRAGANKLGRAEPSFMRKAKTSTDTRADWASAYELVPSLQVAYVWHASSKTCEVAAGLRRLGFEHLQQIIWDKGIAMRTRTHYWFQHEPCWYARKPRAPWFGSGGAANSTVWECPPPKFIFGGSKEEKVDHPTQKPVELFTKPIKNHTHPGDAIYEPFAGSGTAIVAAQQTERHALAMEIDPTYCDVIVRRWEKLTGGKARRERV